MKILEVYCGTKSFSKVVDVDKDIEEHNKYMEVKKEWENKILNIVCLWKTNMLMNYKDYMILKLIWKRE